MNCEHKQVRLTEGKWRCTRKACSTQFVSWTTAATWAQEEREKERQKVEAAYNRLAMLHSETMLEVVELQKKLKHLTSISVYWQRVVDVVLGRGE